MVERAGEVRLGPLDPMLAAIRDRPVPAWDGRRHYAGPRDRTLRFLLELDTVSFSFKGGRAGGRELLATEVDCILWDVSQDLPQARPYHRTRTVFY